MFNRVLVATDLSETDNRLLSLIAQLASRLSLEEINLAHIIPTRLVPASVGMEDEANSAYAKAFAVDQKVNDFLLAKANSFFAESNVKINIIVEEGKAYRKLEELVSKKDIDLLVVGNKVQGEGSGITAMRVARKVPCNVLFVSDTIPTALNKIVVPTDFSKDSATALEAALNLSSTPTDVTAVHVVTLLQPDHYAGWKMTEEYRQTLLDNAQNAFSDFRVKYGFKDTDFKSEIIIDGHRNTAAHMRHYLAGQNPDMVVMGAHGHSAFEKFLFGSVTEDFVHSYHQSPVLIVR